MNDQRNETPAPPWLLTGRAYLLFHYASRGRLLRHAFIPPELRDRFIGGPGAVLLVDYQSSPVGPYRELLFVPGAFRYGAKRRFTITRIFVSTDESVRGGKVNWGIPKERADFSWRREGRLERVTVTHESGQVAALCLRGLGPSLPARTSVLPAALGSIVQPWEGALLATRPRAQGAIRPARLDSASVDGELFPDFTLFRVPLTMEIPRFRMEFPPAEIIRDADRTA